MKQPVDVTDMHAETAHFLPEPFASTLGPYEGRDLGEHFGLSDFGAHVETLPPDSESALRHWHSHSDELVYVLSGELSLVCNEGEFILSAGMAAGFQAGDENGHHLINKSNAPSTFLVVGSRSSEDRVCYPDDDLQWLVENGRAVPARKDGTKY